MRAHVLATVFCVSLPFLTTCGGGSPGGETALEPQPISAAAISVLMMGNSHTVKTKDTHLKKQLTALKKYWRKLIYF